MANNEQFENCQKKKKMSLFKKLDLFRNIVFLLVYIGMLTFNVLRGKVDAKFNMILIIITVVYLFLFVALTITETNNKENKVIKKRVKVAYKVFKKSMLLISALLTAGAIISVRNESLFYKLPMMIFTIFNLSFQLFLTFVISYLSKKIKKEFTNVKENIQQGISGFSDKFKKSEDSEIKEISVSDDENNL